MFMTKLHALYGFTLIGLSTLFVLKLNGIVIVPTLNLPHSMTMEKYLDMPGQVTPMISASGYDITPLSTEKIDKLATKLNEEEARVILNQGTEPAFCGNLTDNKKDGTYVCRLCELPLFKSDAKFTSGTGWPSFFQPFDNDHVLTRSDESFGMVRDEIVCARCGGHLGHVFTDGPKPTGLRFCVNSVSLEFVEKGDSLPLKPVAAQVETAYFAGGCFWGVEDRFAQLDGVLDAVSGYMGGDTQNPSYKDVCYGNTGHAETVMLRYDPSKVSYKELLEFFFKIHNPTQGNRQGPDVGTQYRSAIYTANAQQEQLAKQFVVDQQQKGKWSDKTITTELAPAGVFYAAEDYHQDYHLKNGGHCAIPD